MDRIRQEIAEDPAMLYNQRGKSLKRSKRPPTCCAPGCFEIRVPPSPYCYAHENS